MTLTEKLNKLKLLEEMPALFYYTEKEVINQSLLERRTLQKAKYDVLSNSNIPVIPFNKII
jgi:hypothetical protein